MVVSGWTSLWDLSASFFFTKLSSKALIHVELQRVYFCKSGSTKTFYNRMNLKLPKCICLPMIIVLFWMNAQNYELRALFSESLRKRITVIFLFLIYHICVDMDAVAYIKYGWYRCVLHRQENLICQQKGIKKLLEMVLHFNHLIHIVMLIPLLIGC